MAKLTSKQELFVEEYLIDLNATQAAIRAGYSPKTANEQGSRMLANVSIRARIDIEMAERSKRTGINADRVLQELGRLGFINACDVIDTDTVTVKSDAVRDDTAAIASVKMKIVPTRYGDIIEREIKLHDKNKSLEMIGKHLGLLSDNINLSGNMSFDIKVDYGENIDN